MIDSMTSARERIGRLDVAIAAGFGLLGLLLMYAVHGRPTIRTSRAAVRPLMTVPAPVASAARR